MKFFGIDLGTSTCSVSYTVDSPRPNFIPQPVVVEFSVDPENSLGSKSPVVPSVVAQPPTGTIFAFEADKSHVRGRNCQTIFRSVKSHLGTDRSYVRAAHSLNTPVRVWAGLIRRLCEMTVAEKGRDFDPRQHPTVLTVPASFAKAQRDDTVEAAGLAGFNVEKTADLVQLIDEPVAALIDLLNHADIELYAKANDWNTVLVFDFGGGTCDLVVLKFRYDASKPTGIHVKPLAISQYNQMGGDTIDSAIMDKVIWPQVCRQNGVKREQLTATERRRIEDRLRFGACRRLKEKINGDPRLKEIVHAHNSIALGEQFRREDLARICEIKQLETENIEYSDRKELQGTVEFCANDLYEVMLPFLEPDPFSKDFMVGESNRCEPFAKLIEKTMEKAGLAPADLDLLVLHGGSCKSPFIPWGFKRMQRMGLLASDCKIIETPDLITSVARGAALYGCLSKKHGKPYIAPIAPEEMWIETVGKEFEIMIHAGEQLPYTKMFDKHFYLSSAGQREIVVPIHIGYDAARRRLAETLTIKIAQDNLPQSHPIEVELKIGADKDSLWRFRPKGYSWTIAELVANCWIGREPTAEVKQLLETRKTIRAAMDKNARLPALTLELEALHAARAGFPEEGLAQIEDVIADSEKNSTAHNIKALIHAQRGEYQLSVESHKIASDLEPNNMVLRGNYGTALFEVKQYEAAVLVMREALSKDPSLTYLHAWLVNAFQALENTQEMSKELERWHAHAKLKAIRCPDNVSAWEEFRSVALRMGRYEDADEANERIGELRRPRNLLAGAKHG